MPLEAHIDFAFGSRLGFPFPALLAQAMITHAVAQGLPREFAERAAKGVVAGRATPAGERRPSESARHDRLSRTTAAALSHDGPRLHGLVAAGLEAAAAKAAAMASG